MRIKKTAWIAVLIFLFGMMNVTALQCEEFTDYVPLWTSYDGEGYKNWVRRDAGDSTGYYSWNPENKCPETGCFIENIKVLSRVLRFEDIGDKIGYVQISNAEETDCNDPSKAIYSKYISYREGKDSSETGFIWDCGSSQKGNLCKLGEEDKYVGECFSMKINADRYVLTDVRAINYTWCWGDAGLEGIQGSTLGERSLKQGIYFVILPILAISILIYFKLGRKNGA